MDYLYEKDASTPLSMTSLLLFNRKERKAWYAIYFLPQSKQRKTQRHRDSPENIISYLPKFSKKTYFGSPDSRSQIE